MTGPDPTPSDSSPDSPADSASPDSPTGPDRRPDFRPGQVVTVFRSRLRPDAGPEYADTAAEMARLAAGMPGLVDVTAFTAQDGERLTLVTFADEASQRAWREQVDHRAAQQAGRDRFYAEYSLQVCETRRVRRFP